jgi:hypothetical protein
MYLAFRGTLVSYIFKYAMYAMHSYWLRIILVLD